MCLNLKIAIVSISGFRYRVTSGILGSLYSFLFNYKSTAVELYHGTVWIEFKNIRKSAAPVQDMSNLLPEPRVAPDEG